MEHIDPHQLSLFVDDELDRRETALVEEHLARCEACRATRDGFLAVRERVRAAAPAADRLAQQRALRDILAERPEPFWRRRVALPAPVFAALIVTLALTVVLLVVQRLAPTRRERAEAPTPAPTPATAELDPSRYDRGNRLEIYVARHGREER